MKFRSFAITWLFSSLQASSANRCVKDRCQLLLVANKPLVGSRWYVFRHPIWKTGWIFSLAGFCSKFYLFFAALGCGPLEEASLQYEPHTEPRSFNMMRDKKEEYIYKWVKVKEAGAV
ncbi:hypothetical protein HAX54_006587, partial [Datura stramonium]|nr:hypothetical protein [Datura stramonium]